LHKQVAAGRWRAFARPGKRLKAGQRVDFAAGLWAEVAAKGEDGEITLVFDREGPALMAALEAHGAMPLPPYIKRDGLADARDRDDYQTVFAARPGAVAAPTAGLHFTEALLAALDAQGVRRVTVTLHVGAGTFLPVKTERVEDHVVHAEWGTIGEAAALEVNRARVGGGRVVAVGTTSLRLLETAAGEDGVLGPFSGETDIFITPGYRFKITDLLLTNFHLPRSTLFMLVCAFAGTQRMKRAYRHAIENGYRFDSYGDCCLLQRGPGS
jgi:S-adenosylmethionine:tRNA ribosyltransferase-isomerase